MKHIITMGLVTLLTTHTAWANPSAFKELDRETGDCEADVNTLKKEIKVCEAKASKASTLEIKLRDSSNNLAASELKAEQLALTLKSKNVEIRKSKKQLKKAQNDLLQLAFSYKELEGKLKESQAYLDQEKTANQKLTKQLMESEKKPKEPISTTPPPTQTKPIKQAEPHPKTQLAEQGHCMQAQKNVRARALRSYARQLCFHHPKTFTCLLDCSTRYYTIQQATDIEQTRSVWGM